jgi:site-specific recombinase XerD
MKKSIKPLKDHITDFLEYTEVEKGLSNKTQENYKMFLNKFLEFLGSANRLEIKPHELNAKDVWNYKLFLARSRSFSTGSILKKTTQHYYLIALRSLLNYFTDRDIESMPSSKVNLPKNNLRNQKIKFLTLDQIRTLLDSPNTKNKQGLRDKALLELLFSTGMRVSEVMSLNVNQFDSKKIDQELSITGKGNKARVVYISERAMQWIKKYLSTRSDVSPALFINYRPSSELTDEKRLTVRSIERIIKHYVKLTGLPAFTSPHTLRHSYATDLLSQGVDIRSIQEFLGHSHIATTQVYTHVTNKRLKDIHKKYHSGSRLS